VKDDDDDDNVALGRTPGMGAGMPPLNPMMTGMSGMSAMASMPGMPGMGPMPGMPMAGMGGSPMGFAPGMGPWGAGAWPGMGGAPNMLSAQQFMPMAPPMMGGYPSMCGGGTRSVYDGGASDAGGPSAGWGVVSVYGDAYGPVRAPVFGGGERGWGAPPRVPPSESGHLGVPAARPPRPRTKSSPNAAPLLGGVDAPASAQLPPMPQPGRSPGAPPWRGGLLPPSSWARQYETALRD
jgi:hypothetical protein